MVRHHHGVLNLVHLCSLQPRRAGLSIGALGKRMGDLLQIACQLAQPVNRR